MKVSIDELKQTAHKALLNQGYKEDEAAIVLDVLLYAQLRGNNQGIVKLIGSGMPNGATADIEVIKESPVSAWLDGHQHQAMVVISQAVDMAITKAGKSGVAVVGAKGINTSSGALGYYARKIAEAGLVGQIFAGSMETVAPAGSSQAVFGTNPLAVGVPGKDGPLVLDMATAAMAFFGVVEANTAGRPLPENVAYDAGGTPTTDAAKALDGALLTFDKGGYKGSGLSMMVQALTGPVMGAYFTGVGDQESNWGGHLIVVFDPELFDGSESTKSGVSKLVNTTKQARKLPGVDEILAPSERGDRLAAERLAAGEIEVEDNLWAELQKAAV